MIWIVIPVFNRKEFTRACLLSLRKQTYQQFKVVVVDDGSTDGTDEMLATEFPEVVLLKGDGNLFWTAATNLGIKEALKQGASHVMTLNNDTLASEDFLEKMMHWARKEPDALLGALQVEANTGKAIYGGERAKWKSASSVKLLEKVGRDAKGIHRTSLFPGRGLLIPRKVFDVIGLFEEKKLPHYLADYDFTLMADRAGFPVYANFDARLLIYPDESGDSKIRKSGKSLKNYYNHLFSIKGGGNLRNYTIYVLRNCPAKDLPFALASGYARRLFGYWLRD